MSVYLFLSHYLLPHISKEHDNHKVRNPALITTCELGLCVTCDEYVPKLLSVNYQKAEMFANKILKYISAILNI